MMPSTDAAWHLDKKVPLALIFAMAAQIATAFWFASNIVGRVEHIEVSDEKQDGDIKDVKTGLQNIQVGAATLTAQITALKETLDEVRTNQHETNDLLRQLTSKGLKP
jgi:peptidoglycan hydrolase CwlO-like protein